MFHSGLEDGIYREAIIKYDGENVDESEDMILLLTDIFNLY